MGGGGGGCQVGAMTIDINYGSVPPQLWTDEGTEILN